MKRIAKRLCGGVLASLLALTLAFSLVPFVNVEVRAEEPLITITGLDIPASVDLSEEMNGFADISMDLVSLKDGVVLRPDTVPGAIFAYRDEENGWTADADGNRYSPVYSGYLEVGKTYAYDIIINSNQNADPILVNINGKSYRAKISPFSSDGYYTHDLFVNLGTLGADGSFSGGDFSDKPVTDIILSPANVTMKVGENKNLSLTIKPDDATDKSVTWSSSNTGIATVSNGTVIAVSPGKATITAKTEDGSNLDATCEVTVKSDSGNTPGGSGKVDVPKDKEKGNFGAGGLANTENEIKNAVLTQEDKDAMAEGKNINVWAEIIKQEANKVKDAEKQKIMAKLPATFNVGAYLDIKLFKQMTGDDVPTSIEKTNGKVKIKFTVPKELQKGGRTYDIIRLHDGEATVLGVTREGYELTIETDGFSTYALIYSDNPAAATNTATSPKTGEAQNIPALLSFIGLCGLMGLLVSRKRA